MTDTPNKIELGEGAMRSRLIGSHAGEPTLVGSRAAQPALTGSNAGTRTLVNTARDLRPVPIAAPVLPVEDFTRWATRSIASAEMRVTALEMALATGGFNHQSFPVLDRLPFTPVYFSYCTSAVEILAASPVDIEWQAGLVQDPVFIERDGTFTHRITVHRPGRYIVMVRITVYADLTGLTYAEDRMDLWWGGIKDSSDVLFTGTAPHDQLIYLYSAYASDAYPPEMTLSFPAVIEITNQDDYFYVQAQKYTDNMVMKVTEASIAVWRAIRT